MSKLNFEYLNKDNKNLFNVTLEKESLVQSKVISLENLIKILQTLNNTVDQTDTGYLPKNLLRSVSSPSSNKAHQRPSYKDMPWNDKNENPTSQ